MKIKPSKLSVLISLLMVILAVVSAAGATYAWFSSNVYLSEMEFTAGQLDPSLQIMYWNKKSTEVDKWTPIPATGLEATLVPRFGLLNDMEELPKNGNVYLKFKVDDTSGAKYQYDIRVKSVSILVYSLSGAVYTKIENDPIVSGINYYSATLPQACINSYYAVSEDEDITIEEPSEENENPPTIFTGSASQIISENQSFSSGSYTTGEEYLYVKLTLRYNELLNIMRQIPIEHMPYGIEFVMEIESETRTKDL